MGILDSRPCLKCVVDFFVDYARKASVVGVGAGLAGAGATIAEPDLTGLPWWVNGIIAAAVAFYGAYRPDQQGEGMIARAEFRAKQASDESWSGRTHCNAPEEGWHIGDGRGFAAFR